MRSTKFPSELTYRAHAMLVVMDVECFGAALANSDLSVLENKLVEWLRECQAATLAWLWQPA